MVHEGVCLSVRIDYSTGGRGENADEMRARA